MYSEFHASGIQIEHELCEHMHELFIKRGYSNIVHKYMNTTLGYDGIIKEYLKGRKLDDILNFNMPETEIIENWL